MTSLRQQLEPLIAFAFVEFGLSEEQFLRQTPRQWQLRFQAWEAKQAREDKRVARICMVLAWCHGDSQATEQDFMPVKIDLTPDTPEQMIAALKAAEPKQLHG